MVEKGYANYLNYAERSLGETSVDFTVFLAERLKYIFREMGFRYDEVNAIVNADCDDPLDGMESPIAFP
jgi:glycyl-tRNA synthetase beta subunit